MSELVDDYNTKDWANEGDIVLIDRDSFDSNQVLHGDDPEVIFEIEKNDNKPKIGSQPLVIRPESIGGATIKRKRLIFARKAKSVTESRIVYICLSLGMEAGVCL
jgi:hypothetical protein